MTKENKAGKTNVLIVDDCPYVNKQVEMFGEDFGLNFEISNCRQFFESLEELITKKEGFDLALLDKSGGEGGNYDHRMYSVVSKEYGLEPNNNYPLVDLIYRLVQKNPDCRVIINSIFSDEVRDAILPETRHNVTFGRKNFDEVQGWLATNTGKEEEYHNWLLRRFS